MTTTSPEATRASWDAIADGYDTYVTPTHLDLGAEAIGRAGVGAGMRFLDVAAGSGSLSIPAARLGASVLATDLSPIMLDRLARRAADEGMEGIDVRVMDGHALDLDDDSFDVAGSQYGVMLFPDLPRALDEFVRVTKPGGRVLLVVFGPPAQVEFLTLLPGSGADGRSRASRACHRTRRRFPFQVADPERLRAALVEAGLRGRPGRDGHHAEPFESGEHLWDWVVNSNPIGRHARRRPGR